MQKSRQTSLAILVLPAALVAWPVAGHADDDVAKVVAHTLKAGSGQARLCERPERIRAAVTKSVIALMTAGRLQGDPKTVGDAARRQLIRKCRTR